MRKNATHQIALQTQELIDSGVGKKDASVFQDISSLISVFDISTYTGKTSPIFAVHDKHQGDYIAQYISEDHNIGEMSIKEGYYIYFTEAHNFLLNEAQNKKHHAYDGASLLSEPYTISDLLVLYAAHEVRHKIQENNGIALFRNGDSSKVTDPDLKTIIAVLETESDADKYFQDPKEFDSEVIGRYVSQVLHEGMNNFRQGTLAAMLKAQPHHF